MRSSFALVLAVLLDAMTLAFVAVLLWRDHIPRELGAGLLGALIGARARWLADSPPPPAPPSPPADRELAPREPPARPSQLARVALQESALGALFWPVFRLDHA